MMKLKKKLICFIAALTLSLFTYKGSIAMEIFEKEIIGNICIHEKNPPKEGIFYKFDTKEKLILSKGKYNLSANINVVVNVISKKIQDEAVLMMAFYAGDIKNKVVKMDDELIVHKGLVYYFTAGSFGWNGGIMSLNKLVEFDRKTEISVLLGLRKSSSGNPKYNALCVTGDSYGRSYLQAVKLD